MATKILVESFYDQLTQSTMDTSSTEVTVDVAPTNDIDYVILENGEANQEMAKYQAKAGLVLSSMLRGLSLTALTDTEVAGNKKTHTVNSSIQITDVHYLLNDKVSNSAEETITGQKTFSAAPIFTLGATSGAAAASATELIRYGEAVKNTGNETIAGIKTFSSIPLGPSSSPTTDDQLSRKKYVDDQIATLSVPAFITTHAIYTPAYMTGGALAETNVALWDSVSDGSFRCTFDGTARNIDGINFTATHIDGIVTDMDGVAARIQTYIRAATGSTETCVWSVDHFVITSVLTTVTSQISVLSTSSGTVGTDISGVGTVWMDSEVGRGTATAAVLDPTADVGKVWKNEASGNLSDDALDRTATPTASKTPKADGSGVLDSGWIPFAIFGNGADGDLVTSGNITLTSDKFYDDLTVSAGHTIDADGYRIFVRGTLTIEATGVIENNGTVGGVGGNTSGGTAGNGGAGGAGGTGNSLPAGTTGSAGGAGGVTAVGVVGVVGSAKTKCFHTTNGVAGGTGSSSSGTVRVGGAGGAGGASTNTRKNIPGAGIAEYTFAENNGTVFETSAGGGGGGGGGGDNNVGGNYSGAGGGGAGGSGGFVAIYARTLINNGTIRAIGAVGGAGGNAATGGGGGGGAGGNGGTILIVTMAKSGTGVETVTGGAGGVIGTGGSANGTSGTAGASGIAVTVTF